MRHYLALINDFAHDFFTGLWLSCLLVLWLVQHQATPADSLLAAAILGNFFRLQCWSMALILLTGLGRYWHVKGTAGPGQDQARRSLLIVKHALLGVLLVGGTILGYGWAS